MTASTTANVGNALKVLYDGQKMADATYKERPALALLPKSEDFYGDGNYPVPVKYGVTGGGSATFASAQNAISPSLVAKFLVPRVSDYALARLSRELMKASEKDDGAFVKALEMEVDGAISNDSDDVCRAMYGSGTGTIGQVKGAVTSGVVYFVDSSLVYRIEVGMALEISDTDGGAVTGSSATGYVISVDRTPGAETFTVSATAANATGDTPTGWADTKYVRRVGDQNSGWLGFSAWMPATVASNDSFINVNRSKDRQRLAGIYYDGSSLSLEEAHIRGCGYIAKAGGRPVITLESFDSVQALIQSLGSKVTYSKLQGTGAAASIGFDAIELFYPGGKTSIVPDRFSPNGIAYPIMPSTWEIKSLGAVPHIFDYLDNQDARPVYNADQLEIRVGHYGNQLCREPGKNGAIKLQTPST
jgi:hypothetical protein